MARTLGVSLVLVVALFACSASAGLKYNTFYEALSANPNLSILKNAVEKMNMKSMLSKPLNVTILVPNDKAFKAMMAKYNLDISQLNSGNPLITNLMTQVVTYHILPRWYNTASMTVGTKMTTALVRRGNFGVRNPTFISVTGVVGKNSEGKPLPKLKGVGSWAQVVNANIRCGPGIAHVISYPLLPFDPSTIRL